jgi:hypothetical protein
MIAVYRQYAKVGEMPVFVGVRWKAQRWMKNQS